MATIEKRKNSSGSHVYRIAIRKKGAESEWKTFKTEEAAKLYVFYKENLIENIRNFDVPIQERITLKQLLEFKLESMNANDVRGRNDVTRAMNMFVDYFKDKVFYHQISIEEWEKAALYIYEMPVYRGYKNEHNKRRMTVETLRKIFAYASACVSNTVALGIPLENLPLKVIHSTILPLMKKNKVISHGD